MDFEFYSYISPKLCMETQTKLRHFFKKSASNVLTIKVQYALLNSNVSKLKGSTTLNIENSQFWQPFA